ncbi:hypothetical protein [Rathayibacter soli]|uniref:hypothetical protein n=1 Tax=Rathayibacter soli TaxID=3144168 RepID=UPI0027E4BF69|nr:hypothetical protein [Glaciibacter superstes]
MCDDDDSCAGFETSEGLRDLLNRLHAAGCDTWQHNPEVAALMTHAANRYAALARKHGLDPWEAAAAAFEAMRTQAVRTADDPWAVVTRAVQVTMIAEERGNGLLCSTDQARRSKYSVFHDAERFSDRENPLPDYHPAFHINPDDEDTDTANDPTGSAPRNGRSRGDESAAVATAVEDITGLFSALGWPTAAARTAIEYVCGRLAAATSRASAHESLRRDRHARALLDLPAESWNALLRVVLGHPDPDRAHTSVGRGVLLRLLVGEPVHALLADDDLVLSISLSAPSQAFGGDRHE